LSDVDRDVLAPPPNRRAMKYPPTATTIHATVAAVNATQIATCAQENPPPLDQ
jgi:hypothetical protein